jgi:Fe-S-cluster-containing dehydrogenase component/CRP-like cAMP-binding protein
MKMSLLNKSHAARRKSEPAQVRPAGGTGSRSRFLELMTMTTQTVATVRPQRWDHPLDPAMDSARVSWLLKLPPFNSMDAARFSETTPLQGILQNDCRLLKLRAGEVVFQEGQYGASAYLVLDGQIRVFLSRLLTENELQRRRSQRVRSSGWLGFLKRRLGSSSADRRARQRTREQPRNLRPDGEEKPVQFDIHSSGLQTRIFLQDIPGVLSAHQTANIGSGELFGEMAAVTRTAREFTAMSHTESLVLEIRWQGLKLLKQDTAFRQLLDERYRAEVLRSHLRESSLFRFVPDTHLDAVVAATALEQFGDLEWFAKYRKQSSYSAAEQIQHEPLIAQEGQYSAALWIVRSGFARLSRRQGAGHRTLAYLGKGQMFGMRELSHNYRSDHHGPPLPYQESLRAIGYVDVLRIPKQIVMEHVLPFVRTNDLPQPIESPRYEFGQPVLDTPLSDAGAEVETGLLEFLVEHRLINGRQSMLIDMNRCTRCDDCVRACASTHGGTPVFTRQGPRYGQWMIAQACMHCEDPVCMIGCPTGAIHRDAESGLVQINNSTCIGCKSCAESCPYDNIRMLPRADNTGRKLVDQSTGEAILLATKCDLCTSATGQPVCQSACPHDALVRISLANVKQLSEHVTKRAG